MAHSHEDNMEGPAEYKPTARNTERHDSKGMKIQQFSSYIYVCSDSEDFEVETDLRPHWPLL